MNVIKQTTIDGKEARMILLDDNKTVQIVFDDEIISSASGNIWNNIKGEEWAQHGLLQIEVESYIKKKTARDELKRIAETVF